MVEPGRQRDENKDNVNSSSALPLRDIHMLPTPDLWPLAPGWWVLALAGLITLIVASRWVEARLRRWRRRRGTLRALVQLRHNLSQGCNSAQFAAELSILLRRVALHRFPRDAVAGLSGERWLTFLDATGGGGKFTRGPGRVLTTAPYAATADLDIEGLYILVRHWIEQNI